jgi:putative cell wall-binding protein
MRRLRAKGKAVAVLLAALMVMGLLPVAPAYAAEQYEGGAGELPLYMMNDHTPIGVRFSAETTPTGLLPDQEYYVKVRFTVGTSPSSATNRGYTWNPDTGRWVQEREEWTEFPTVWTNSEGQLLTPDGKTGLQWVYAKFGDEKVSGPRYVLVSLSATGAASTYNPSNPPVINVLDAATEGSWVHNGIDMADIGAAIDGTRAAVRGADSTGDGSKDTSPIYSLWQTEANVVDDDGDGDVDEADEDWGLSGTMGDFRMAVPVETTATVSTNRVLRFDDFLTAPADCSLAVGAADAVPPSSVPGLEAIGGVAQVELNWDAAMDTGGSGLGGYRIYRWETVDPEVSPPFTPPALLIGTTAAGTTTYVDPNVENGVSYSYLVRAEDDDTNIGPRSATAEATPGAANDLLRDSGGDRYATAIAISEATFKDDSVETVVIATGLAFPDALAASGLAGVHGSPLLLVGSSVTSALTDEIDRLGATSVVVVGGESAVSADVYDALDADYDVKRVFGADRYETAAEVAREIAALGGSDTGAYFVRGDSFADALSVSPFAYSLKRPVLLVRTDGVPAATEDVIDELAMTQGWIAGGLSAVDADTAADLETLLGSAPVRWDGLNRYETAAAVAEAHVALALADFGYIGIATGLNFADALGGGAAAGMNGGVLLLTQTDALPAATSEILDANVLIIDEVHVFGGDAAVTQGVYDEIDSILSQP